MIEITPESVQQLVRDILRGGIIDEPDLRRRAEPFMRAVRRTGLAWERVPLPSSRPLPRAAPKPITKRRERVEG